MVTWTFDLMALVVGFCVGMLVGGILFAIMETLDGGAWSKGFYEGCDLRHKIEDINNAIDYAKRSIPGGKTCHTRFTESKKTEQGHS